MCVIEKFSDLDEKGLVTHRERARERERLRERERG